MFSILRHFIVEYGWYCHLPDGATVLETQLEDVKPTPQHLFYFSMYLYKAFFIWIVKEAAFVLFSSMFLMLSLNSQQIYTFREQENWIYFFLFPAIIPIRPQTTWILGVWFKSNLRLIPPLNLILVLHF